MGTMLKVFEAVFFLTAVVRSVVPFSVFQAHAAYLTNCDCVACGCDRSHGRERCRRI